MDNNITMSVHHPALSRRTSDSAYAVLLDALPVGNRCYKPEGPRKGACDLCLLLDGRSIPETTRHIALKCPFSAFAQESVLRATLKVITLDDNTRESDLALTCADLVHEHRRFLVTGYWYDPAKASCPRPGEKTPPSASLPSSSCVPSLRVAIATLTS